MAIDWYKATLVFLKDNKILMLIVASLLGGNIYQATGRTTQIQATPKVVNQSCGCINSHNKEYH